MDKKKTIFREYFPGYMGHIPVKGEVIGMTVGATNDYIKEILNREPPQEEKLVPSAHKDYSFYNKAYFHENLSKDYKLEEPNIFSNQSKEANTWIGGSKYKIYPQHIPGYKAHIPGITSSNIFGLSYAKATSVAVKGDYYKNLDVPPEDRYKSVFKQYYTKPKVRLDEDKQEINAKSRMFDPNYNPNEEQECKEKESQEQHNDNPLEMANSFKTLLEMEKKPAKDLPFIVGYKGFRKGVKAENYYGKNFRETSLNAHNTDRSALRLPNATSTR